MFEITIQIQYPCIRWINPTSLDSRGLCGTVAPASSACYMGGIPFECAHHQSGFCGTYIQPSLKLTAKAPENRPGTKRKLVFQPSIFRCYTVLVSGRVHCRKSLENMECFHDFRGPEKIEDTKSMLRYLLFQFARQVVKKNQHQHLQSRLGSRHPGLQNTPLGKADSCWFQPSFLDSNFNSSRVIEDDPPSKTGSFATAEKMNCRTNALPNHVVGKSSMT